MADNRSSPVAGASISDKDFIFGKAIGEGSFSTVYVAKEINTGRELAIKVCQKAQIKRENKVQYVTRERDVMKMLLQKPHPFFVQLYCTFQDRERLYFVMSWARRGELLDYMKKLGSFDQTVTRFYAGELVLAMEHLHTLGVIHRDLKPENVLLSDDMHIKVSDFGSAKILDKPEVSPNRPTPLVPPPKSRQSFVGTAQYVSPEILTNNSSCSFGCDWWALGCMIYQMLAGLPPFRAPTEYLVFKKITDLDFSFPDGFDQVARDLVEKLLVIDASQRLGSECCGGVEGVKAHPFFENMDWDNLSKSPPPDIRPFLPGTAENEALHSNYKVPDHLDPGLNFQSMPRLLGLELAQVFPQADDPDSPPPAASACPVEQRLGREETPSAGSAASTSASTSTAAGGNIRRTEIEIMLSLTPDEKTKAVKRQEAEHAYFRYVEGNLIVKSGLLDKRKGLFARTRMFLLTTGPKLYYIDPSNMTLKGTIPWSANMRAEPKNFKVFFVHTPNRTYYLIDNTGFALAWCAAIEAVREHYFPKAADLDNNNQSPAVNAANPGNKSSSSTLKLDNSNNRTVDIECSKGVSLVGCPPRPQGIMTLSGETIGYADDDSNLGGFPVGAVAGKETLVSPQRSRDELSMIQEMNGSSGGEDDEAQMSGVD